MSLKDRLRNFDTQQTVQSEFRVYTVQGAILSVVTVALILYLVITEAIFNFQVTLQERVHVNATSPSGLELEFDISLPMVPCKNLNIDANDPAGQIQTLHLDRKHHVWKHRMRLTTDGRRVLIGRKTKLELGSTLNNDKELLSILESAAQKKVNQTVNDDENDSSEDANTACGDCYGAGEEGECCNTCDDVIRAYKRKGWVMSDRSTIRQCAKADLEAAATQDGEGCNIHGIVALDSGGGNLHIAPGRGSGEEASDLLDMLFESFQKWNVSHTIHKIRFGNEYPAAVNQLDGETRTIADSYGMYQYYFQVWCSAFFFVLCCTRLHSRRERSLTICLLYSPAGCPHALSIS
jgi:endoplasmic reticulum-Golgi intermediate compartment protein 3